MFNVRNQIIDLFTYRILQMYSVFMLCFSDKWSRNFSIWWIKIDHHSETPDRSRSWTQAYSATWRISLSWPTDSVRRLWSRPWRRWPITWQKCSKYWTKVIPAACKTRRIYRTQDLSWIQIATKANNMTSSRRTENETESVSILLYSVMLFFSCFVMEQEHFMILNKRDVIIRLTIENTGRSCNVLSCMWRFIRWMALFNSTSVHGLYWRGQRSLCDSERSCF